MTRRMTIALVFALVLASAFVTASGSAREWTAERPGGAVSRSTPDASWQGSVTSFDASAPGRQSTPPPIGVTCTFANPAYAGDCVETTTRTEKEKPAAACRPILDCLNNSRCVKNYCQSTTIRQGWTLKKAE